MAILVTCYVLLVYIVMLSQFTLVCFLIYYGLSIYVECFLRLHSSAIPV